MIVLISIFFYRILIPNLYLYCTNTEAKRCFNVSGVYLLGAGLRGVAAVVADLRRVDVDPDQAEGGHRHPRHRVVELYAPR